MRRADQTDVVVDLVEIELEGGALVEITVSTIQGRYLLRPDKRGRVNELVLGVIGRAQQLTSISIVGIAVLSSHFHILAVPETAMQMADFMRHVDTNISDEIGRLNDWPGPLLVRRYKAIRVNNEEEDQVGRLRYLLGAGVKEQLVEKAIDWPGVHSARALTRDHPLRGFGGGGLAAILETPRAYFISTLVNFIERPR